MDGAISVPELTQEQYGDLINDIMLSSVIARQNTIKFHEYVIREETSRTRLKAPPHQRLLFEFIDAHSMCVISMPPAHTKTFTSASLGIRFLGEDPTSRGAFISATQTQAEKPLGMIKDYIEYSPELRMVYPRLVPSNRLGDSWTQTEITVNRPMGIRDSSVMALGYRGAIDGSRLRWVIVDDLLNEENTATLDQRNAIHHWFDTSVMSRLDPSPNTKIIVTNTAWHHDDLCHRLEKMGWPTLRMGITGYIEINNTDFDSDLIRPSSPGSLECRLVDNDPDPNNEQTLWKDKFNIEVVEKLRRTHLPSTFARLFDQRCRVDSEAACKDEWIEAALMKGRGMSFVSFYDGEDPTFTGVDLAISEKETAAETVLFTFKVSPLGYRTILDIEGGRWDGPTIVKKIIHKQRCYNSIVRVENNAAQDFIRQFTLNEDVSIPIQAHTTGRAKAHPEHGVAGLFIELANGAWIFPCDYLLQPHPFLRKFIDGCKYYTPTAHTSDYLMAAYFGRESAKKYGIPSGGSTASMGIRNALASTGSLLSR